MFCPAGTRAIGGSAVVGGSTKVRINTETLDPSGFTVLAREPAWRGERTVVRRGHRAMCSGRFAARIGVSARRLCIHLDGHSQRDGRLQSWQEGHRRRRTDRQQRCRSGPARVDHDPAGNGSDRCGGCRLRRTRPATAGTGGLRRWRSAPTRSDSGSLSERRRWTRQHRGRGWRYARPGTRIHSGGFDLGSGRGQVNLRTSFLDFDVPGSGRQGFVAQAQEDQSGFSGTWRVGAYAICAA